MFLNEFFAHTCCKYANMDKLGDRWILLVEEGAL